MGILKCFAFVFTMLILRAEHKLNWFSNFRACSVDLRYCSNYLGTKESS